MTSSTSVVFAIEKVTFVSFNENRLTISIKSSKKGAVVQQPRVSLLVEVIIIINNCVPAANTLGRALCACILTRTASKRKASQFSLLVFHSWRRRNQFSHCSEYYTGSNAMRIHQNFLLENYSHCMSATTALYSILY